MQHLLFTAGERGDWLGISGLVIWQGSRKALLGALQFYARSGYQLAPLKKNQGVFSELRYSF